MSAASEKTALKGKLWACFLLPPTLELYAIPTPHFKLLACMAISPAHRVPCLQQNNEPQTDHLRILLFHDGLLECNRLEWSPLGSARNICLANAEAVITSNNIYQVWGIDSKHKWNFLREQRKCYFSNTIDTPVFHLLLRR